MQDQRAPIARSDAARFLVIGTSMFGFEDMRAALQAAVNSGFSERFGDQPGAAACRHTLSNQRRHLSLARSCSKIFFNQSAMRSIFGLGRSDFYLPFFLQSNESNSPRQRSATTIPGEAQSGVGGRLFVFERRLDGLRRNEQYGRF
jgi:hypothetical protein